MDKKTRVKSNRRSRHSRIRKKISGSNQKPRLCLHRSLNHLEAQLIDDMDSRTIASLSTKDKEFKNDVSGHKGNVKSATELGKSFAEKVVAKGYKNVVFDRGGYLYHGRIKAFAEAARESGLEF